MKTVGPSHRGDLARHRESRKRVFMSGSSPASNWNIANLVTIIRMLVAPLLLWLVLLDGGAHELWRIFGAMIFIIAISTDGLDGALARKRNLVTPSGVILDPLADKMLVGSALVSLAIVNELSWWVVAVVLGRELAISAVRLIKITEKALPVSRGGKLKTIIQAIALSSWLLPSWLLLGNWIFVVNWILMAAVLVATVVTGFDYVYRALRGNED